MKRVILFFLGWGLLAACSAPGPAVAGQTPTAAPRSSPTPAPLPTPALEVELWLDDPSPEPGARVILYGSLIKHGVRLGGMAMRASWPDPDQERGVPNCSVQVIYGSGVCIVETQGFPSGVYVPINVTFEYQGRLYQGQTGFTPH